MMKKAFLALCAAIILLAVVFFGSSQPKALAQEPVGPNDYLNGQKVSKIPLDQAPSVILTNIMTNETEPTIEVEFLLTRADYLIKFCNTFLVTKTLTHGLKFEWLGEEALIGEKSLGPWQITLDSGRCLGLRIPWRWQTIDNPFYIDPSDYLMGNLWWYLLEPDAPRYEELRDIYFYKNLPLSIELGVNGAYHYLTNPAPVEVWFNGECLLDTNDNQATWYWQLRASLDPKEEAVILVPWDKNKNPIGDLRLVCAINDQWGSIGETWASGKRTLIFLPMVMKSQ